MITRNYMFFMEQRRFIKKLIKKHKYSDDCEMIKTLQSDLRCLDAEIAKYVWWHDARRSLYLFIREWFR